MKEEERILSYVAVKSSRETWEVKEKKEDGGRRKKKRLSIVHGRKEAQGKVGNEERGKRSK